MSTASQAKRPIMAAIVIVIIVVAAVAVYFMTQQPSAPMTSTTEMMTSSVAAPSTLAIDDPFWPSGDLNQLNSIYAIPYPDWLTYTVYQSLVTLNGTSLYANGDVQILPMLATDWSVSSDGTTYTFNLRQNVVFSNGDPFNAYQVWGQMYGLYYLANNGTAFLNGYNVFDMSTAKFGPATLDLMAKSGLVTPSQDLLTIMEDTTWPIYVTGPNQIVFHLKAPFNWFPHTLVAFVGLIFDTQYVLQNGGFGTPTTFNTNFNLKPIPGTGPYVVTDVSQNSYVKFAKSSNYWGTSLGASDIQANPYLDPGHVQNVIIYAKSDDVARYTDLSTGAAQISGILSQNWPLVLKNPDKYGYAVMPDASMAFVGISMNTQRYPTNITAFRQAVVHAVNLTDISQRVFFGQLAPMIGPEYPAQKDWYDLGNLPQYAYDTTLAKQYLAQSGVDVSTLAPLEFRVVSGCTYCNSAAQIVQADLAQIGITVNIEVTPGSQWGLPYVAGAGSYKQGLANSQTVAQFTWFGTGTFAPGAPTPADAWLLFANENTPANDYAIYANPVVQKCVDAWTSTNDQNTIRDLCTAAQKQMYDDAPYIWLGGIKLVFGGGSVAWDKTVVKGGLLDPVFTGISSTLVFNTVTFVGS
ncbi:MAG TPA: ABC transporter substrate-binding protein [Methylomirabilota bacterium]|nr:ABC transporter substrate-binding protein [Methylomirabilota bacterium]